MGTLGRRGFLLLTGVALGWAQLAMAQSSVETTVVDAPHPSTPQLPQQESHQEPQQGPLLTNASVDPTLALLEKVSRRELPSHSVFATNSSFDEHGAAVSLRFHSPPNQAQLDALERLGLEFDRDRNDTGGRACRLGSICRARASWRAIDSLAAQPNLIRVEALWQPALQLPLEVTGELVGASRAHVDPRGEADGSGVTIALIDTGIDVLHPSFFRADGGYFAWLDLNQNGAFDPGVDAVDIDGDGEASHNETLRVLDATTVIDFTDSEFDNDDGVLQPGRDWLYADMNGDLTRNVGIDAGFNEETPAYGEAVFVADDADGDGVLSPHEKLVRLKSSKIRKVVTSDGVYLRGENLIEAGSTHASAFFHGSGSAGILAGGQLGFHRRVGIAPEAELLVYGLGATLMEDTALPLSYLEAAVDDGAHVVLHEWTNAFTQPLDGSTNFEAAMGQARDVSIVQVTPAGNLNLSGKHVQRDAEAGATLSLIFRVGEGFEDDDEVLPYLSIFGSLQWRGEHALELALISPSDERVELGDGSASTAIGAAQLEVVRETTSRGTTVAQFYLEADSSQPPLEQGLWTFEISGFTTPDTVYGRITDAYSNWLAGVSWETPSPGATTLAFPATADPAVAVAAYAARRATPIEGGAQVGELRGFSGRGPRIDGANAIDLAAPDDPFVPLGVTRGVLNAGWGRSWFTPFGGTSGASPHVAASIALLRQQNPDWTSDQLEERLFVTANTSGLEPAADAFPDTGWGHGKLDLFRALFDEAPAPNGSPEAELSVEQDGRAVVWDASASQDPDGDALEYRFDVNYDGVWETDWTAEATYRVDAPAGVPQWGVLQWGRVEVRDKHGALHGATAVLEESSGGGGGAENSDAAAFADAGDVTDARLEKPSDSTCTSTPGSRIPAPLHLLVGLGLLVAWRRRSPSTK